ncbi:MAG: histone deacetylase [Leifsonia sp.]
MDRIWYVAYGTNLSLARFRCYIHGGRPVGGSRTYPGCRDRTEPEDDVGLDIPGSLYFSGRSSVWGGGMAVYDAGGTGRVAGRAYLLSVGQFADLIAQETRQPPGTDLDLAVLERTGHQSVGPGRYQTLIRVGGRHGLPMATFTSAAAGDRDVTAPAAIYLRVMAAGLRESRSWSPPRIAAYLAGIAGAERAWTRAAIEAIAA